MASTTAIAKNFTNQYSEFELPAGWACALEGSEWVCQSSDKDRKKEAIIILAAKIRGSQDSLDQYMGYLKETKTYTLPGGKTQVSEAKYYKKITVNGHDWIDALHLASEVPGFYTRYLATVKEDLGVAVTLSVSKDLYSIYKPVFDKIVESLRVFRQKQVDLAQVQGIKGKDENLIDEATFIPDQDEKPELVAARKKGHSGSGGGATDILLYGGIIFAAIVFFLLKKRKKKGPNPPA